MTRTTRVSRHLAAVCLVSLLWIDASAAEFAFDGEVGTATGAFSALIPVGTPVAGPVNFDDGAIASGLAGPNDFNEIDVNVGGFCFSTRADTSGCPLAGTLVPITSIDQASVSFTDNFPSGGTFSITAFSPTFQISIPIDFDLDNETFFADGGLLGTASGAIAFVRPAEITVSPNPAAFNDTPGGSTDLLDITVTNNGDLDLTINAVANNDMLADPFSVPSEDCTTLSPLSTGETCIVMVQFAPTGGGPFADSFDITSNDQANPSVTVNVSGTGLTGDIAVAPTPLSFASTTVGETNVRTVTVTNNGGASLDLGQVSMPADNQFTVGNDGCSGMSLGAMGGQCNFQVTFAPASAQMFMTSLQIPSNDPDTPVFTLNMTGTGVTAAAAEIELSTETLAFAELLVGQSATMDIVVTSTGNADLVIDTGALQFTGVDAADFSQSNDCMLSLDPDFSCTITVTFEPLTGGLGKVATLTINSNANLRPVVDINVSASAFAGARIEVDPTELSFGSPSSPVDIGATAIASTTITNTGNAALNVISTTFSASASEFMVQSQDCTDVAPTASCTITVQFTPLTEEDKTGTMTIESNDSDGAMPVVSLAGFVFRGPRVGITDFEVTLEEGDTVEIGQTATTDIALQSTGTQDLVIDSITLGGENASEFSVTEDCTDAPVASGSSCSIGVVFAPESAGNKTATLTIVSNDATAVTRGTSSTKVIMLRASASEPPPPPPAPLNVPPAFARSDVGGTGSVGWALLSLGAALWFVRRRRIAKGAGIIGNNGLAGCLVIAVLGFAAAPEKGHAISFESESGNVTGSWDTTISYGLGYRLQAAADNLIGTINGGTKFSVNGDDGTQNFHRGIYSNALKLTSELEVNYSPANLSLFLRGFYFYDFELEDGTRDRTPLSQASLGRAGSDGDLLDAFVSWQFDIGERPAEFRVGEQVINWGESTFIQGGMNVINHINVSALRVPGAELREALLPQDLVFFSIGATPNLDFEIVYQYDWDDTEPDPVGTYFSTNDFAVDGGTAVRLGFGDTPDTPPPAFFTPEHDFNAIPRGNDGVPADDGQWGWAARYFAEDFNNGTEFGIYYYNYHSRLPLISARTGSFEGLSLAGAIGLGDEAIAVAAIDYLAMNPGDTSGAIAAGVAAAPTLPDYVSQGIAATAISRGLPTALAIAAAYSSDAFANTPSTGTDPFNSPAGQTAQFITEFPEDIQLYGFSWNTTLGQTAWQGEIAHHQNRPLQIDDLEILFAGLSSLRASFAQFGQLGSFSFVGGQANPDTPPLTPINGYLRRDYTQANMAFTRLFGPMFGADLGVALFEVGYHHVHGFPSKDVLRFDGPGTVVSGNPDLAPTAHPGKPLLGPEFFPDENSWGYRLAGRLDFSNVFGSFNMSPRFAWQHDVDGITPGPAGAFIEGRKALTIGNRFTYQNQWELDMSYSRFFGAGFQNEIHDRDFVGASIKYTF